jgi:hypothetical protein
MTNRFFSLMLPIFPGANNLENRIALRRLCLSEPLYTKKKSPAARLSGKDERCRRLGLELGPAMLQLEFQANEREPVIIQEKIELDGPVAFLSLNRDERAFYVAVREACIISADGGFYAIKRKVDGLQATYDGGKPYTVEISDVVQAKNLFQSGLSFRLEDDDFVF